MAIQCKFYAPGHKVSKADIDTFLSASGKEPFARRIVVDTSGTDWGKNAKTRSKASKSLSRVSPWRICAIQTSTGARIHWARCRHPRPASAKFLEITRYAQVPQSWRGSPNTTAEPWSWLAAPARPSLRSPSLASSWSEKAALRGFFSQSPRSHSSIRRWMIRLPRPMARLPRGQCVRIRKYRQPRETILLPIPRSIYRSRRRLTHSALLIHCVQITQPRVCRLFSRPINPSSSSTMHKRSLVTVGVTST